MLNRHSPKELKTAIPIAYFDTVALWLTRELKDWELDTLNSLCGRVMSPRPAPTSKYWMSLAGFRVTLSLQQPTRDAFRFLRDRLLIRPRINRVDCSLDFPTDSYISAREMQNYFDSRILKPYHRPSHQVSAYKGSTTYIGFRNKHSKFVSYADLPGKHHQGPSCHLECRFQSRRVVHTLGIKLLDDLANFDHKKFWAMRLKLHEYELEKLGKIWNKRHLNSLPRYFGEGPWAQNHDLRTGSLVCRRLLEGGMDNPILAELSDSFSARGLSIKGALISLDKLPAIERIRTV